MTQGGHHGTAAGTAAGTTLRASWLGCTLDAGWPEPVGWRTPGVDAVVASLVGPERSADALERALRILAWERASDTLDLDAALQDVEALWAVLESSQLAPVSRRQARRWLVDAWVDAIAADRGAPCVDPLSGLHTAGYLLGRIHELDRTCLEPPTALVLLSLRWREPRGPWLRIATIMSAARALRERVRSDATLGQHGTHTAFALVLDDARARLERRALSRACEAEPMAGADACADLVPVPDDRDKVPALLGRLRRPANRVDYEVPPDRQNRPGTVD
ncbi:MAG: hypothetical protein ACRDWI_09380 [Jiangellaceae bacterium]